MKQILYLLLLLFAVPTAVHASHQPEFSTAGFFHLEGSGREVYSFNPAWRFYQGDTLNAHTMAFDDSQWSVVSLPHGIEYLPTEASGCVNYQGVVWYRKRFTPTKALQGKKIFLHFEAVMGKSKVYLNGKLLKEHFGGFLPLIVEVGNELKWGAENIVAVCADNSDDPIYPPGKPQDVLDFSYFGGIYRDCWLIAHNEIYITDPNVEQEEAGGGLFVAYDNVSDQSADVLLKAHFRNATSAPFVGVWECELQTQEGKSLYLFNQKVTLAAQEALHFTDKIVVRDPQLWSPNSPTLYNLIVKLRDKRGRVVDGYRRRIGIRSFEFKGVEGFWLNGKPYGEPLMGANRHQDFAVVGNALSNSLHWRDAKKLKDVGLSVIRNAHYPQDPAFMDACDELGLLVIVNTPGWQFWNNAPIFGQRVYNDIRNMVRRDRNHPSVWLWEPILNETHYPEDFAKNTRDIVMAEYPYPSCYTACDNEARGSEHFPVLFSHPTNGDARWAIKELDPSKTYYTREWGDNVDNWNSHNSPSRVSRAWGEQAMLVQANHYAKPPYQYSCYDSFYRTTPQHVGGSLWHSFDHQRGYHPDPFYGGVMDAFRQPKYSYYLFMAQRKPEVQPQLIAESGPMVHIAHEMTPFSGKEVTVYSNCEEVRLTVQHENKQFTYHKPQSEEGIPSPIITFAEGYDFMADKAMSRNRKTEEVYLLAEGLMNGEVVATHKVLPARRPERLLLWVDDEDTGLKADGSDLVTIVAAVADKEGNIKRLNNYFVEFEVEGEGRIVGGADIFANPAPVRWGTAPVLIQSTLQPGTIKVTARVCFEGSQMPSRATLELSSTKPTQPLLYDESEAALIDKMNLVRVTKSSQKGSADQELEQLRRELNELRLKEVERQQTEFGEDR